MSYWKRVLLLLFALLNGALVMALVGCSQEVQSVSGTKMKTVGKLKTDENGNTSEQNNISDKIRAESDPDKVWHLYVISPYDRQLIMQSTVKGKITSSNKRLTPKTLTGQGMRFQVAGTTYYTDEMPSEDGTFGSSAEYIYWKDAEGRNRRHYLLHGQIIHVVDEKMTLPELMGTE